MIFDWLKSGMKETAEKLTKNMLLLTEKNILILAKGNDEIF